MKKKAAQKQAAIEREPARLKQSEQARGDGDAEGKQAQEPAAPAGKQKKERPVRCIHRHTDVELRRAFPKLCEKLIDKATEDASVQHTRLLLQMAEFDKPKAAKRRTGPSLSAMLLAELKRRQDEREAATDGDAGVANPESKAIEIPAEGATSEDAEKQ